MPIGLLGFGEDAVHVGFLGNVALDSYSLAAGFGDLGDNLVCAFFAGGVVDDDGGSFLGEALCDVGSDALGGSCDYCYFSCELAHFL